MKHEEKYEGGWVVRQKLGNVISRISLMLVAMFVSLTISAQTGKIQVEGVVKDDLGEPLIGASVAEKGTTNGTMTDADGKFALSVESNGTLTFSYLGFVAQEIKVNGKEMFNITLVEDGKVLDEVVVTALGMKREQKALGYAVAELKGDDLDSNVLNPIDALKGKVAGMEVASSDGGLFGSTKIQIRGASTLKGNNQPIYVVDGIILDNSTQGKSADWDGDANDYGNELKNLNPDDFATVSVLKGAAATALYGSRGLNGAVVITTKGGGAQKGFGVSVNQSVGFDVVYKTPHLQETYGPGTIPGAIDYGETDTNGQYKRWDTNQFKLNSAGNPSLIGADGMGWGPKFDGRPIEDYVYDQIAYSPRKNNMKDAYKTGLQSNTNVVVKGGNDKTTYYSSLSYKYAKGTVPSNSFSRLSMLLKASHQVSDRVTVSANMTFATSKPKNAAPNIGEGFGAGSSYNRLYDVKKFQHRYRGDTHNGMANTKYGDSDGNIPGKGLWWRLYENTYKQTEYNVRPSVDVDVKILDWMSFKGEANMNYYSKKGEKKELGSGYQNEGGYYELSEYEKFQETYAGTFTFNKQLGDFSLGGFARGEFFQTNVTDLLGKTDNGFIIPGGYFLGNSKAQAKVEGKVKDRKRMMSLVGAANIGWKNQLYLDITARNDWSSALTRSKGGGKNSYFYPSVGGSWIATETFKNALPEWISFAKLRASWAQVGNDTDAYDVNSTYGVGRYANAGGGIYYNTIPDVLISPNLEPEKKTAYEFGLDWRFFDNRLNFDVTYYKENTKKQIMDIALPGESGMKFQRINAGNIQNQGVEIAVNAIPFRNNDWEWDVNITFAKNDNKIKSLHPNVANYIGLEGDVAYGNYRVGSVAQVGGDYGLLMSDSKPKRDEKGNIVLAWRDGYRAAFPARSGVAEKVGKSAPDFTGSFGTGVSFKGFTLRASFDFRYGGYVASYSNKYGLAYGLTHTSLAGRDESRGGITWESQYADSKGIIFHDGIIPEGVLPADTKFTAVNGKEVVLKEATEFRDLVEQGLLEPVHAGDYHYWTNQWNTGTVNDNWVSKVKYISLREVSLSYVVPKVFCGKLGAKGIRLTATGRDLGYLYNSLPNKINPESVRGNRTAEFRERSFMPYTASYTMSVGIDF